MHRWISYAPKQTLCSGSGLSPSRHRISWTQKHFEANRVRDNAAASAINGGAIAALLQSDWQQEGREKLDGKPGIALAPEEAARWQLAQAPVQGPAALVVIGGHNIPNSSQSMTPLHWKEQGATDFSKVYKWCHACFALV